MISLLLMRFIILITQHRTPITGIVVNLEDDKVIVSTVREQYTIGYFRPIFESEAFVCLHRFFGSRKEDVYTSTISAITYKDGKILK